MTDHNIIDRLCNEHIELPGCPGIVVTRGWAYQWLVRMGYDPKERGFASADYLAFGRKATDAPLTDLDDHSMSGFLAAVERDILGDV